MAYEIGLINYSTVYKAAIEDDWETAKRIFLDENNGFNDFNACFTDYSDTLLHTAVGTNLSHTFVRELVDRIMNIGDLQMLRIRNENGNIALHYAAMVGNIQAAMLLINIDPEMAQIENSSGHTPLALAAQCGCRETLIYLLEVTKDVTGEGGTSPYHGRHGADLLSFTVYAGFYDVALYLVHKYPNLVTEKNTIFPDLVTALQVLAAKPNPFRYASKLGFWQRIIYSCITVNEKKAVEPIIEPSEVNTNQNQFSEASYGTVPFWSVLSYLVPHVNKMLFIKVRHIQSQALLKLMCSTVMNTGNKALASDVFGGAIFTAVKHGFYELIEECCYQYPVVIKHKVEGLNLFMAAITERQEKVYNLLYQMSGHRVFPSTEYAPIGNALHIAGKLSPRHRLLRVTGAALQMQRELQWFKEVEKFVPPSNQGHLNCEMKTPRMVFSSEHKELLIEAKQWMKDASSAGTVVAALIVTLAFAAIFTAPGGNNDNGRPLFLNEGVFILFAISDAIALFASSTSVMMFLAVLNSRFAEEDFLYALPKRLTLGLISLFISLAATMVAFSASLSLVLRDKIQGTAVPVILLASVPVTLFLLLQYPLLVELVRSTFGRSIFYKQNNLYLH